MKERIAHNNDSAPHQSQKRDWIAEFNNAPKFIDDTCANIKAISNAAIDKKSDTQQNERPTRVQQHEIDHHLVKLSEIFYDIRQGTNVYHDNFLSEKIDKEKSPKIFEAMVNKFLEDKWKQANIELVHLTAANVAPSEIKKAIGMDAKSTEIPPASHGI